MKRIPVLCLALAASLGLATAASAATFAPSSATFTGAGPVTIMRGGISLSCTMTVTGQINATGSAGTITGLAMSGSIPCNSFLPQTVSWPMTAPSTTTINITGSSVWGCGAPPSPIVSAWTNSPPTLTLNFTTTAPACTIIGPIPVPGISVF